MNQADGPEGQRAGPTDLDMAVAVVMATEDQDFRVALALAVEGPSALQRPLDDVAVLAADIIERRDPAWLAATARIQDSEP
jgi:hypothetical protein